MAVMLKGLSTVHSSSDSDALAGMRQALHGETDLRVIAPALGDQRFARILALAPGVDPVIGALGALAGEVPDLLTPGAIESPALHAAIASLIGTDVGDRVLEAWAWVAPAGWGAPHDAALINAVHNNRCAPWVAAALIGPCDASAALLQSSGDIARAVQRWGRTTPDHPTAWTDHLTPKERTRLLDALPPGSFGAMLCLPWLPKERAAASIAAPDNLWTGTALDAYAAASPVARARHADVLSTLIQHAGCGHLAELTRLAIATGRDDAWAHIASSLRAVPEAAVQSVATAMWKNVRDDVQGIILSAADHNDVCAAIAYACGQHDHPPPITETTALGFFAAVTREVWASMATEERQRWLEHMVDDHLYLVVQSLGPDPAFLARTDVNAALISAIRCHVRYDNAVRQTLFPVAIRDLPCVDPAILTVLSESSSDPVAFVQIAGRTLNMPSAFAAWIQRNSGAQVLATVLCTLRIGTERDSLTPAARCQTLATAFAGWSVANANEFLAALPNDIGAALHLDSDALITALKTSSCTSAFRQILDTLASLPPSVALPSLHALTALAVSHSPDERQSAGEGLAQTLRDYGRIFSAIIRALHDDVRSAILPPSHDSRIESALLGLAAANPPITHRLAYAIRDNNPTAALDALAAAPLDKMLHLWRVLPKALQQSALGDRHALASAAAAPGGADALMQTLRAWEEDNDPLPLLALRMLIDDNPDRRARGVALLAQQPDMAVSLLPLLHHDLRMLLERDSHIAVAGADLPPPSSPAPAPMLPPRRRRSR
jgi:hypothetical protein